MNRYRYRDYWNEDDSGNLKRTIIQRIKDDEVKRFMELTEDITNNGKKRTDKLELSDFDRQWLAKLKIKGW